MRKIISFFRNLFDFRKPVIFELECVDLVIEDHALLLVSWRFEKQYAINVIEANTSYRSTAGSAIVKIPQDINEITVAVSNYWRKSKRKFQLRKLQMDESTMRLLMSELHLMPLPAVDPFDMKLKKFPHKANIPGAQIKSRNIHIKNISIQINATPINYTAT